MKIREINHNGIELLGFKFHLFPYEILLPKECVVMYDCSNKSEFKMTNVDIDEGSNYNINYFETFYVNEDKDCNKVDRNTVCGYYSILMFINKNIKILDDLPNLDDITDKKEALDVFMKICANATLITVYIDKSYEVSNVYIDYIIRLNEFDDYETRRLFLLSDQFDWMKYVLKEEY